MSTLCFKRDELLALLKKLKPTDKLLLVGDQGVYIMSQQDPVEGRTICYAEGFNPNSDPDFYENKRDIFGGDDGADEIGTAVSLFPIVWASKEYVTVRLTATQIQIKSA